jgi:hypothetical protein
LSRQLAVSQAQVKFTGDALKKSERETRLLREEAARAKQQTAQVRAACANDVRKRDVQIQRLKGHLNEQQRGTTGGSGGSRAKRDAGGVMKIVIVPGSGQTSSNGSAVTSGSGGSDGNSNAAVDTDEYKNKLRNETTDFLTQLSQELSDENDNLITLVRNSLATLKELQGLPESVALRAVAQRQDPMDANDMPREQNDVNNMVTAPPLSYSSLSADMDHVLENLRNLLTNPNFVPIEEVESREGEIQKLRSGWEKMEGKWREALLMMDGWRKRMSEGDAVNLEDIKRGLGLGRDLGVTVNGRGLLSASVMAVVEDSLTELESSAVLEGISESEEEVGEDSEGEFETGANTGFGFTTTNYQKLQNPLVEVHGNAHKSPRRVTFKATSHDQDTLETNGPRKTDNDVENIQRPQSAAATLPQKKTSSQSRASQSSRPKLTAGNLALYESPSPVLFLDPDEERPVRSQNARKRSSSPTPLEEERVSRLTVQEKLNVAAAEAEAAMVAAGLNLKDIDKLDGLEILHHGNQLGRARDLNAETAKSSKNVKGTTRDLDVCDEEKQQPNTHVQSNVKITTATTTRSTRVASGVKRTRITGRARRRKSTLTPLELADLMLNC